jgi:hypothetical protein
MRKLTGGIAAALFAAGGAQAQVATLRPIADARLRYEHVDQDGLARDAEALTARIRAGAEARRGAWSALIEGEATLVLHDAFNDVRNGRTDRPLVIDPRNLQLNQAYLRYAKPGGALSATLGRQRIELLDQRFVGSAPFRQNDQTFDAARLQIGEAQGPAIDLSYVRRALTVNGARGRGARPTAVSGDNLFAVAGVPTPLGRLSSFAFLVDQDEATVQGYQLSSQSYGLRLAGSRTMAPGTTIAYAASWARQRGYHRNPNRYQADYWLGEVTATRNGLSGTAGIEALGADDGRALTSFQTPLASLFKFQGWADKFTTTPPDGLRDLYAGAGYSWSPARLPGPVSLSAVLHRFTSDRQPRHYGNEIDLLATLKWRRTLLSIRYARYDARALATDTDKLWLSVDWTL